MSTLGHPIIADPERLTCAPEADDSDESAALCEAQTAVMAARWALNSAFESILDAIEDGGTLTQSALGDIKDACATLAAFLEE